MELLLLLARGLVLVLMYAFLLVLVFALMADARAARPAARNAPAPDFAPSPAAPRTPAAAPTVTRLEVRAGTPPITGRSYTLYGPLEIGRGATCDISIPNPFVSARHARIAPVDGAWVVEDLGSKNGTLVNGEPLESPHPLQPGDRVLIGDTEFVAQ